VTSLLIWLGILWACFAFGAAALRRLHVEGAGPAEEAPFAIALGMGALSYLMLGVGLLGWLRPGVGVALVVALGLLGWRHVVRLPWEVGAALKGARSWRLAATPLLVFFLVACALTLIGALAPSGDMDYDGLVYHLAVPKIYLQEGRLHPLPWESHSNFPFALEMLYLLGMLLRGWMKGQIVAKLFHFGCGWLTALAIYAFCRRWWGPRAGWLGAAAFLAIPLVGWEMMVAYNELAFALYAFLAVYALSIWWGNRQTSKGWLWVAAIMCGMAMGTKMLGGTVLIFGVLALGWLLLRETERGRALARMAVFVVIALAIASPWYLKSYLWTGNPVYPFYYEHFGGEHWTAARAEAYAAAQQAFGMGGGALKFLALPWNLTMRPQAFFDQPGALRYFNVAIWMFAPLMLALIPILLLLRHIGRAGAMALWFALLYTALWFEMSQNGRYLIPILPGLCACAGLAAARLLEVRRLASAAVMVAFVLVCLSGLSASFVLSASAARVAVGLESQSEYLTRTSRVYPFCEAVTRATPAEARVLVFGDEPRLFYLDRDYMLGDHTEILNQQDRGSPEMLLAALRRIQVTHVLMPEVMVFSPAPAPGSLESALHGLAGAGVLRPVTDYYGPMSLWALASER